MKYNGSFDMIDYDPETGVAVWSARPSNRVKVGDTIGCKNTQGYLVVGMRGKIHLLHRVVWELVNGPIPSGMQIDHINGVRDDNRLKNLRLVTHAGNCRNRQQAAGVHFQANGWVAGICVDGKSIYLGRRPTKSEAVLLRKEAEKTYGYGEFS